MACKYFLRKPKDCILYSGLSFLWVWAGFNDAAIQIYPKSPQNNLHKTNVHPKRQRGPSSQRVYGFQDEFVRRHAQTKLLVLGVASTLARLQQSCRHITFNDQAGPHLWLRGKDCGTRLKPSEYHSSTCSTLLQLFFLTSFQTMGKPNK